MRLKGGPDQSRGLRILRSQFNLFLRSLTIINYRLAFTRVQSLDFNVASFLEFAFRPIGVDLSPRLGGHSRGGIWERSPPGADAVASLSTLN